MNNTHLFNRLLFVFALTIQAAAHDRVVPKETAEQLFVRRVLPVLHEKCLACHGNDEDDVKGGLDLRTLASTVKGGDSEEAAVVLGKPEESPLYLAATRTHESWSAMPPKEADKLYAEQLGWLKDWIANGAPWPNDSRVQAIAKANADKWAVEDGVIVKTVGALSPQWANRRYKPEGLWGYQRVRKSDASVDANSIDQFIAAKASAGLEPAPLADRATLIRRATFDLTGLPPKPDEVDAFMKDNRSDAEAFASLVERLLASPHYGERMAQHWLDVTRYADSSGLANDYERGNAWRFRDYVVRSFNADKPYDQFVREQIAGDEIEPDNPEMLVATGFLRMGPWELTGMEVAKVARQRFLDDVTNSVGETFLAHSLQCARCHDHKFDPIPTHDYYSVQAVFGTTQIAERPAPFLNVENTQGFEERKFLEQSRTDHQATLKGLEEKSLDAAPQWLKENNVDPQPWNAALEEAKKAGKVHRGGNFSAARNILMKQGVPENEIPPRMLGWTPEEIGMERIASKGLERLRWELDRFEPVALSVYNGRTPEVTSINAPFRIPSKHLSEGVLEETAILTGGDPFGSSTKVKPGVLSVLDNVQTTAIPDTIEGRRKAFADWVASPENPLTTRAIVNRIWLWHFDQPIAGNPNNFGSTGKRPTHPELLDWLAATFVQKGWSFKAMHRMILNSEAYQRSTTHPDLKKLAEKDATGTSYAVFKPRRLTAEELRDAMLTATGELNPMLGGIPNRPEINIEAAMQPRQVMGTFAAAWTPNPLPSQRHRRSIYSQKIRGLPDPSLEVFNAPVSDFSCERREASSVTPQVFSLLNGQSSHARSLALANRAVTETRTDEEALARIFMLTLSRRPSESEMQACLDHWRDIESLQGNNVASSPKPPIEIRRDAIEENTGEKFSFNEKLHAYVEFVPDLHPGDVPKHTRALADVCLAILNCNEYCYVY